MIRSTGAEARVPGGEVSRVALLNGTNPSAAEFRERGGRVIGGKLLLMAREGVERWRGGSVKGLDAGGEDARAVGGEV